MNLQELIDSSEYVKIPKGTYYTSGIFIHSNQTIEFEEGTIIKADIEESNYKLINTRVAGINLEWYPALINIIDSTNVKIIGHAIIDGLGEYWWNKYWGEDKNGGMREEYDKNNLRWACDYDCMRPRNILIQNSSNVVLEDVESFRSGFWNIHILYSHDVIVKNVIISTIDKESPSTDGIDIDSSYNVIIDSVETDCFDDSICIKSGRDMDGIKTNIPSHDIEIKNCIIKKGFGITIGSEVSGGIYNVNIHDIKYENTDCGFRIKSSKSRKGYIKDINVFNLDLVNVSYLFNMQLDWNPSYNNIVVDNKNIKPAWKKIIEAVPDDIPNTQISNLTFNNIKSTYNKEYNGISRIFNIIGFDDENIKNVIFDNMHIKAKEYGILKNIEYFISNSDLKYETIINDINNEYDNR